MRMKEVRARVIDPVLVEILWHNIADTLVEIG